MSELLRFEADFKTIQVVYNSIGNKELNTSIKIATTRKQLCPTIGYLYPDCERALMSANNVDALRNAVTGI
jgi:V-type H+-transporting ATPase subunit d